MVVANEAGAEAVREAMTGIAGHRGAVTEPVVQDGVAFVQATVEGDVASPAAFDRVEEVRDRVHAVDGADALVGGWSAIYLDTKVASARDNLVIIPIVLLVVFLILVLLLRAVTAPLILLGTVVLSFSAALGISALLFEYVFDFAGSDPGFPLFAFVFLVALGIDYNIFLMTRVREEALAPRDPGRARSWRSPPPVASSPRPAWCWRRRSSSSARSRWCSSPSWGSRSRWASCSTR